MKNRYLLLLLAAALPNLAPAQAQLKITPFVHCVDSGPSGITYYIGYESFEQSVAQFPFGSNNRFIPDPAERQQPTLFFPGLHERAFRITAPVNGTVIWVFNTHVMVASPDATPCVPLPTLPVAVAGVPYFQQLSAFGGSAAGHTWSATRVPTGLTLSTSGLLSGTPLTRGTFQLAVTATDGVATAKKTYSLTINDVLTISDALSTRPPGFVPQFRTVTQPGVSNNAIANCDLQEFVITGGGSCIVPNQNTIQGRVATSLATANGWSITCSGGTATAFAVCQLKP